MNAAFMLFDPGGRAPRRRAARRGGSHASRRGTASTTGHRPGGPTVGRPGTPAPALITPGCTAGRPANGMRRTWRWRIGCSTPPAMATCSCTSTLRSRTSPGCPEGSHVGHFGQALRSWQGCYLLRGRQEPLHWRGLARLCAGREAAAADGLAQDQSRRPDKLRRCMRSPTSACSLLRGTRSERRWTTSWSTATTTWTTRRLGEQRPSDPKMGP